MDYFLEAFMARTQSDIAVTASAQDVTKDSTPEADRRRWRWVCLPSFALCCLTTLLVCVAHLGWIVIDAQYPHTVFWMQIQVGLQRPDVHPSVVAYGFWDIMWDGVRGWDSLGPRMLLFAVSAITAVASFVLMLLQFLRRATIRRMLLIVLGLCAWLSLWVSYDKLSKWAVLRRARNALPRFEAAAEPLSQHWPTTHGTLPEAGAFWAYPDKRPNLLLLRARAGNPLCEDFGYKIERSDQGAIRFNLSGATDCEIEFHPNGSKPSSHSSRLGASTVFLREATLLKENWYLVRYGGP